MSFNPEKFYRFMGGLIIKFFYKVEFIGFEKIPHTGPILIISNHVSYVDGLLIQTACNRPIRFIIDEFIYKLPVVNYFMRHNKAIPILPKKESVIQALDGISQGLEDGDAIGIFPEGQLTYTSHLGRFKPGIEWMIERDPVPIYPIAIRGMWDSMFSRKYRKAKFRWMPRGFRGRVVLVCGDVIHPGNVRVNHLQRVVLSLKQSVDNM